MQRIAVFFWGQAVCFSAGLGVAFAEQDTALTEQSLFTDLPVVLTVTRLPQNILEVPASMTVIDRRMIDASGATEIPDLLRLVAGFQLAHAGGNRTSVTYHGMSDEYSRRIQVLVDGRSIYMPANGGVDWPDIPLSIEDIDRIEVLRGPNGVAFGANSFMGVVNIITRHAGDAQGTFAKVQAGEVGHFRKELLRHGGRRGDLDYRITLEHQSDNGFGDVTLPGKPLPYSIKDDKRSIKLSFRGDYRAGVNDYVNFGFGLNQGPRGQGYISSSSPGNSDVNLTPAFDTYNRRNFQQMKWRRILSSEDEIQINVYHNYSDTQAAFLTAPISVLINVNPALVPLIFPGVSDQQLYVQQHIKAERYNLELERRLRFTDRLRLVWGGEVRHDEVQAEGYLGQDNPISNNLFRAFAHTEWRLDTDYLLNVGAMVEHNDIVGTNVSPRLALNRNLAPGHAMRMSVTRAYRTPTIIEEYANYSQQLSSDLSNFNQLWKSSGGLKPEQITAYELGFMGYLGNSRNSYDLKFFKEVIRDMVSYPTDLNFAKPYANLPPEALVFQNIDHADLYGSELQLKLEADRDNMMSLGFSYAHANGMVTTEINPVFTRDLSRYVPSYTLSFLLDHNFGAGWSGSMAIYHTDHQKFWQDTAVATMDLRVAKRFHSAGREGVFAVAAHNVNNPHFDYQDEYLIEPKVYASLEFTF